MPVALLDINVLIALAWPNHQHHIAAHDWFAAHAAEGWATCPMTQCGFVRIPSNPKIIPQAVAPADAIALLEGMTAHPHHEFWEDDVGLGDRTHVPHERISGHRQVTDAYPLGLCLKRGGQLLTLDQGVTSLARTNDELAALKVILV